MLHIMDDSCTAFLKLVTQSFLKSLNLPLLTVSYLVEEPLNIIKVNLHNSLICHLYLTNPYFSPF